MPLRSRRADRPIGERELILLLSLLMALTALSIDMMLPAFGQLRADFGLAPDSSGVALVVTAFLVGFGVGKLAWGPLSDAIGRKRVLWLGLAIYVAAAAAASLAPSLGVLLVLRLVAGFGTAAIRIVALGTVRDRYEGDRMAKLLSYVMAVFLLVPMLAPMVGAAVLAVGDWRWIFVSFAVVASIAAAWSVRLPETLPPERRLPLALADLVAAGRLVLTSRFAMGYTLALTFLFGFFASYLASSERIIDGVFGLRDWFPLIFGGATVVLVTAILFNPRLIDRFGLRRMVRFALRGYLAAMTLFAVIALATAGRPPFWLYMAGILPILLAHSFVLPNLNSASMLPMGPIAGTAAAVIGAISALGGALLGALIDGAYDGTILPFAIGGLVVTSVAFVFSRWSDATWERDAHRQLRPAAKASSTATAPGQSG